MQGRTLPNFRSLALIGILMFSGIRMPWALNMVGSGQEWAPGSLGYFMNGVLLAVFILSPEIDSWNHIHDCGAKRSHVAKTFGPPYWP